LPLVFLSPTIRVTGFRPQLVHRGAILRPTGRLATGEAICDVEYVKEGAGDASKVLDLSELHEGEGLLGVGEAYLSGVTDREDCPWASVSIVWIGSLVFQARIVAEKIDLTGVVRWNGIGPIGLFDWENP